MTGAVTCGSCGHQASTSDAFCSGCGLALNPADPGSPPSGGFLTNCPSCGGSILPGDRFCTACGTMRPDAAATPSRSAYWSAIQARLAEATKGELEIQEMLGRGAMGAVYLAKQVALGRRVAIKVIAPHLLGDEDGHGVERFRHEAQTVASLRHEHIIKIHTVGQADDLHYFVMDYIDGPSLGMILKERASLPISIVQALLYQVGSALGYAHRRDPGVIHRDIKPANIMLDREGNAVVTDFGISKLTESTGRSLTGTGLIIGTPEYMSPEQCEGRSLTGASDQYALGVVAYEMLCGGAPFTGTQVSVMVAQVTQEPEPISAQNPDCPPEIAEAVMRMLAKSAEDRWPTLPDALAALGAQPLADSGPVRREMKELVASCRRPTEERGTTSGSRAVSGASQIVAAGPLSVFLSPLPTVVEPGDSFDLRAHAHSAEGPEIPAGEIQWMSADPSIAVVEDGRVLAIAPGAVSITASAGAVQSSVILEVANPRPAHIEIERKALQITVGHHAALAATVMDRHGNALVLEVTWVSSDDQIATVSAAGKITGVRPGGAIITVQCGGVEAHATVTVEPVRAESIELSRPPDLVLVADQFELTATPVGDWGDQPLPPVAWSSSDPTVATVGEGRVQAVSAGTVTITASADEAMAEVHLVVAEPTASEVRVDPSHARLEIGQVVRFTSKVKDQRGERLQIEPVWASSDPSIATVDSSGAVQALVPGSVEIIAEADQARGSATVIVTLVPVDVVELSAAAKSLFVGETRSLSIALLDRTGKSVEGRTIDWTVSDARIAAVSDAGAVTGNAPGRVILSAACEGKSASVELQILPVPVSALHIAEPPEAVHAGDRFQLQATAMDASGNALETALSWKSSDPSVAFVSKKGVVRAKKEGEVEVTAIAGGIERSIRLAVAPGAAKAPLLARPVWRFGAAVAVPLVIAVVAVFRFGGDSNPVGSGEPELDPTTAQPAAVAVRFSLDDRPDVIRPGDTLVLAAAALDPDGNVVTGATIEWTVDDPQVARMGAGGRLIALRGGVTLVRAAMGGLQDSIRIVVSEPFVPPILVDDPDLPPADDPPVPRAIARITIGAIDTLMLEGTNQTPALTAFEAGGRIIDLGGRAVTRRSTNPTVISFGEGGISALSAGTAFLVASVDGVADSVFVVVEARVADVSIQGGAVSMAVGQTLELRAAVLSAQRDTLTGWPVRWRSSDPAIVRIDEATGVVTGTAPGTVEIIASIEGIEDRVDATVAAPLPTAPTETEVGSEVSRYVSLLNIGDRDPILALFGEEARAAENTSLLNRMGARDFNATLGRVESASFDGADTATVRFRVSISYRSNFGSTQNRTGNLSATLVREPQGWRLSRCVVAPGTEF